MTKESKQNTADRPPLYLVDSELLDLLYKLKQQSQPIIGVRVRIDKLYQDLNYRNKILELVIDSQDKESCELAWKIQHLQKDTQSQQKTTPVSSDIKPETTVERSKTANVSSVLNMLPENNEQGAPSSVQAPILSDVVEPDPLDVNMGDMSSPVEVLNKIQMSETPPVDVVVPEKSKLPTIVIFMTSILALILALLGVSLYLNLTKPIAVVPETAPISISQIPQKLFNIHGSNTIGEALAPSLLSEYINTQGGGVTRIISGNSALDREMMIQQSDDTLHVIGLASHGSSTGFKALMNGKADLAMSSRKIKDAEVEKLRPEFGILSSPNSEHIIGLDGLAIIVNPDNPVSALNSKQIAQLFSGEITDWSDVGGKSGKVNVYARESSSGTWDTFKSLVLKPNETNLVETARRFESSTELSDTVAADKSGIGFIALPYVRYSKLLAVSEGANTMPIVPTAFTIGTEDYPLSRRLYLYVPQNADNQVKSFVEFVHSPAGQDIVEQHGFVSQNIFASTPYQDKSYPWEYRRLTKNAQRLSLNFRFNSSSNELDNKANRDLNRVVDYIFQNNGRRVLLFGFTDSIGYSEKNLALSKQRVETIKNALNARGVFPAVSMGFGQAIPIASNSTPYGRYKNRRVEIWIE